VARWLIKKPGVAAVQPVGKLRPSRGRAAKPGSDGASPYPEPRPTRSLALPGASPYPEPRTYPELRTYRSYLARLRLRQRWQIVECPLIGRVFAEITLGVAYPFRSEHIPINHFARPIEDVSY
jgi:hypothetical protein